MNSKKLIIKSPPQKKHKGGYQPETNQKPPSDPNLPDSGTTFTKPPSDSKK